MSSRRINGVATGPILDLATAKQLKIGAILHERNSYNADGTYKRWKIISVNTWKSLRNAERIELHIQRGMREHAIINEYALKYYMLPEKGKEQE